MTRAVFDCVVFLQAAANPTGAAGACLALVESGAVILLVSRPILDEARMVFARPAIRKKFPLLTEENAERFLLKVTTLSTLVHDVPATVNLARDPSDQPYVDLAIVAKASFLVSRDNDLLDLMKDVEFRKTYPDLAILDPGEFLQHVRTDMGKELSKE